MPITSLMQPLTDTQRDALRRLTRPTEPSRRMLGMLLILIGSEAAMSGFWFIGSEGLIVLLALLLAVGGSAAGVAGLFVLVNALWMRSIDGSMARQVNDALKRNQAEVIELDADAAWSVTPDDEDAPAVLLRVEAERFVYINMHELYDLIAGEAEGAMTIPPRVRIVRCPPADPLEIEVLPFDGAALSIQDGLPGIDSGDLVRMGPTRVAGEPLTFINLEANLLPPQWRERLCRRVEP